MARSKARAWLLWVLVVQVCALFASVAAYLPRKPWREGNTIARLILDEPTLLESMVLYMGMTNVVLVVLVLIARWSAVRKGLRKRAS